jgi:DNA-binding winged helix-turn-helix (wHTH) protein
LDYGISMNPGPRYQFGDFTLDLATRQLRRQDRSIHLSPKAFDLLHMLVEQRPRLVSKDELIHRLWPDTFVSEVNLATLVAELRRILGEEAAHPRFIRTVHRHGYAFSGTATEESSRSQTEIDFLGSHWVVWKGGQVRLVKGDNVLGRGRRVAVWLDSPTVSRRHARIVLTGPGATLEDLGSRNGTFLRGERVTSSVLLTDGDEIRIGSFLLEYRVNSGQATTIQSDL